MNGFLSHTESYDKLAVAGANLLIETNTNRDRHLLVPAQHERVMRHIDSFKEIERRIGRNLDFVAMQELQIDDQHHNGETIRQSLDLPFGAYQTHSRTAAGENIAVVGRIPDSHEFIKLGKNRYAVAVRMGETCLVTVHLSYTDPERRHLEFETLIDFIAEEQNVVLEGDFNAIPHPFGLRKKLARVGMASAFVLDSRIQPVTLPAPGYAQLRSIPRRIGFELLGGGMQYDDIYVKGDIAVKMTGTVDSASDHRFVYADLIGPKGMFTSSDS